MKDKRQRMALAWPYADPAIAAYIYQTIASGYGALPFAAPIAAVPTVSTPGGYYHQLLSRYALAGCPSAAPSGMPLRPPHGVPSMLDSFHCSGDPCRCGVGYLSPPL